MTKFHFYIVCTLLLLIMCELDVFYFGFLWLGLAFVSFYCALLFIYKNLK